MEFIREAALKIMQRLLPPDAGAVIIEHDDEDIKKMDAPQEQLNSSTTKLVQPLSYSTPVDQTRVVQVNIWTKNG